MRIKLETRKVDCEGDAEKTVVCKDKDVIDIVVLLMSNTFRAHHSQTCARAL